MTRNKVYRFRMRPTPAQERAMLQLAGARRFVWNWALARRKEHYAEHGKTLPFSTLSSELTALKGRAETAWLKEADSQALQQALRDLDRTFKNFFERRARFPRFKARKRDVPRFRVPQRVKITNGRVYCPKVGWVRIRQSREVVGDLKGATFRRDPDGRWYVSLSVAFEVPDGIVDVDPTGVVGIDLGLIDFVTPSDGTKPTPAPKFLRRAAAEVRRAQRIVSRRKPGSKRREKARKRLAAVHRKVRDRRNDFLHKLSADLVRRYAGVCVEDLNVKGLARTKLAKSFADAAMGEFVRQLEYKCDWNRKAFVRIDRFFPSSKMCDRCGALNDRLSLSDRKWECGCGATHDRDLLAARNIRDEGLRMLAVGRTESRNARGRNVSPAKAG